MMIINLSLELNEVWEKDREEKKCNMRWKTSENNFYKILLLNETLVSNNFSLIIDGLSIL